MRRLPTALLLLAETASAMELPRLLWRYSDLLRQPRGHGQPVVVLPGFATDDSSTVLLRNYLGALGYKVCGWGLGLNRGDIPGVIPTVTDLVRRCADDAGQRVRVVGWSLGGVVGREIARDEPDLVERVITMGSPVCGGFKYTSARYWCELFGYDLDTYEAAVEERNRIPLKVPVTSIYATYDGIVAREGCFDPYSEIEHIEVRTTHIGLGMNADVYRIIAQRLATPTARRRRRSGKAELTTASKLQRTG